MQDFGNRLLFQLALTTECIGCTNIILTLTLSFQLALTTECIRQIFRFSNCFNSFNSRSLRSVSWKTAWIYKRSTSFNSHPLWSVSDKDPHEQIGKYISTRPLYKVYSVNTMCIITGLNFQLALTTECILQAAIIRYDSENFQLAPSTECIEPQGNLFLCSLSFNSHPLRSVSSLVAMFLPLVAFQLALTYGAYPQTPWDNY